MGACPSKKMHQWLTRVFKGVSDRLDEEEVKDLATFCFNAAVVDRDQDPLVQMMYDVSTSVFGADADDDPADKKSRMTATDFSIASSSHEQVSFLDVVHLFDVARPRPFLEKVFEPRALRKYVFRKKAWKRLHRKPDMARSSSASSSTVSLQSDLGAVDSLEHRGSQLKELALSKIEFEEKIAALEKKGAALEEKLESQSQDVWTHHSGFLSMVNQQAARWTEMQKTLAKLEARLRDNTILDLVDRVENLETLSANLRGESKELFQMGDTVLKVHSQIMHDLKAMLQSKSKVEPISIHGEQELIAEVKDLRLASASEAKDSPTPGQGPTSARMPDKRYESSPEIQENVQCALDHRDGNIGGAWSHGSQPKVSGKTVTSYRSAMGQRDESVCGLYSYRSCS